MPSPDGLLLPIARNASTCAALALGFEWAIGGGIKPAGPATRGGVGALTATLGLLGQSVSACRPGIQELPSTHGHIGRCAVFGATPAEKWHDWRRGCTSLHPCLRSRSSQADPPTGRAQLRGDLAQGGAGLHVDEPTRPSRHVPGARDLGRQRLWRIESVVGAAVPSHRCPAVARALGANGSGTVVALASLP